MIADRTRRILLIISLTSGCTHYGPRSIETDRTAYNEAIASSWKEQTLLNIVRMRYLDAPFFIDIPQITSSYTVQSAIGMTGGVFPTVNPMAPLVRALGATLNLQGGFQDRPTVVFQPLTGSQFIRNLTAPISPSAILLLLQSGYPADLVLGLTVDSINGIRNRSVSGAVWRAEDIRFKRILELMREMQIAGRFAVRLERDSEANETLVLSLLDGDEDPLTTELRRTLDLDLDAVDFRVAFGAARMGSRELSIQTRSAFRVLQELAAFVDVPERDLSDKAAPPIGHLESGMIRPLRIRSSNEQPDHSYSAIRYSNHWFWIEDNDSGSKRTLSYLLIVLALADSTPKNNLPVVTIQAN